MTRPGVSKTTVLDLREAKQGHFDSLAIGRSASTRYVLDRHLKNPANPSRGRQTRKFQTLGPYFRSSESSRPVESTT